MLDLDMCPPGCDQTDYDTTIIFREQRLDVEDDIAEQRRILEAQRKDADTLVKKTRAVEYNLQQAASELQAFQVMRPYHWTSPVNKTAPHFLFYSSLKNKES